MTSSERNMSASNMANVFPSVRKDSRAPAYAGNSYVESNEHSLAGDDSTQRNFADMISVQGASSMTINPRYEIPQRSEKPMTSMIAN